MESNATGIFPREELQQRLQRMAEREPQAPAVLAARCALRALPIWGTVPDFGFWKDDVCIENLLNGWCGILMAWAGEVVPPEVLTNLHGVVAATRGYIGGGSESPLQGEVLKWANLVATAERCAQIMNRTDQVQQCAIAVDVAEASMPFLAIMAEADGVAAALDDWATLESAGVERLRQFPLWMNAQPGERYYGLVSQFIERQEQLARGGKKLPSALLEMLALLAKALPTFLAGKILKEEAMKFTSALRSLLVNPPTVSASQPVAQPADTIFKATNAPGLATKFTPAPDSAASEPDQAAEEDITLATPPAQDDTLVQRELAYRPSDRQSIEQISDIDHLNRGKLVNALATILAAPGNDSHQTIGLLGDWGVGKSTLVHLLKNELIKRQSQQAFLFAEFNAWAYEHTDNLQAGIAQEMLKALTSDMPAPASQQGKLAQGLKSLRWLQQRFWLTWQFAIALNGGKLIWLLLMLLLAVLPFTWGELGSTLKQIFSGASSESGKVMVSMVGSGVWIAGFLYYFFTRLKSVLANPLAKELLTYLKLPDYGEHLGAIPVMRKNIETLCRVRLTARSKKQQSKRLLFVVDDLDRCGHEGIVKVFEAVRLVLDLQRVTVIIAVDQRIALAALALHYKDLAEHHQLQNPRAIARDYLAKVIHLPIMLSPPDNDSIDAYLQHIWHEQSGDDAPLNVSAQPAGKTLPPTQHTTPLPAQKSTTEPAAESTIKPTPAAPTGASNVVTLPGITPHAAGVNASPTGNPSVTGATEKPAPMPAQPLTPPASEPPLKAGLSSAQKQAFQHWVKHFQLANPRQLKRLHNSYNLLRHFYGEDFTVRLDEASANQSRGVDFPLLVTLFALEYLNSLDNPPLRAQLKACLQGRTERAFKSESDEQPPHRIDSAVIQLVNRNMPDKPVHLVTAVEPFVLPAIEQNGKNATGIPAAKA